VLEARKKGPDNLRAEKGTLADRRLPLVSVFHKGRWKEGREYDRAVKRHNGFVASPEWREEG